MSYIPKWIKIPSGEKRIEGTILYEVRWTSRHGEYHGDTQPEAEFFTNEEEAEEFALTLRKAFKMLKQTGSETWVEGPTKRT